jgi:hypothetical protein
VYEPSDLERQNGRLFADNVRNLMAKHLQVPASDKQLEDALKPDLRV